MATVIIPKYNLKHDMRSAPEVLLIEVVQRGRTAATCNTEVTATVAPLCIYRVLRISRWRCSTRSPDDSTTTTQRHL
ncbi:hypothetical protein RvY_17727 [Ramazzottius varieornatus]|uniref:Uncharacterized protein n=1 Tax=Ramazzottius varieornatus TaxID=947166 RepID=A0A1D1W8V9_RAMVA|nr:hypothetical protein RvY_17727 [Ramazzottius varieornatus]